MSVLDTIDTTVTFEWAATRTIGTLIQLGGRQAVVTALRSPPEGTTLFLRVEGESLEEGIAIDGTCVGVTDSDWGEQQVEIDIQRVGTTSSATVLRDFIEKHGIQRGGSVSVGRNRDNPELKRFVYVLPERRAENDAPTSQPPPGYPPPPPPQQGQAGSSPASPPGTLPPRPGSAELQQTRALPAGTLRAGGLQKTPSEPTRIESDPVLLGGAGPEGGNPAGGQRFSDPPASLGFGDDDADEPILVNTVQADVSFASAVMPAAPVAPASESLVKRLFGGGRKSSSGTEKAAAQRPAAQPRPQPAVESPGLRPSGKALGAKEHAISGSMLAVQALFAVDHAVRAERPVVFEVGRKKLNGIMLRMGETKLRIRASTAPALYERISVTVTGSGGAKDTLTLKCEVTRVRAAEENGGEPAFDARVTPGNSPATMARLRHLIAEFETPASPAES